jgi:hypothetical protein
VWSYTCTHPVCLVVWCLDKHRDFTFSRTFNGMTQLVKITVAMTLVKLESSFWAHLKANEMEFPLWNTRVGLTWVNFKVFKVDL